MCTKIPKFMTKAIIPNPSNLKPVTKSDHVLPKISQIDFSIQGFHPSYPDIPSNSISCLNLLPTWRWRIQTKQNQTQWSMLNVCSTYLEKRLWMRWSQSTVVHNTTPLSIISYWRNLLTWLKWMTILHCNVIMLSGVALRTTVLWLHLIYSLLCQ